MSAAMGGAGAAATAPVAGASGGRAIPPSGGTDNGNNARRRKRHILCLRLDGGPSFIVTGQEGRTLLALAKAGPAGVTALEVSTWALRLAAYVMPLRRKGLDIETLRERHPGGWHGRYVLHTPVTLETMEGPGHA